MAFWDWFKEKAKKETAREVALDELNSVINEEKKKLENKAEELKEQVSQKLKHFILELRSELIALKQVNIENRKEYEKIKLLVKENLQVYVSRLEKLINSLEKLEAEPSAYITETISIFENFEKNSKKNFEKATILIGKEIGGVKESIKKLLQDLGELPEQDIFEKMEKLINLKNTKQKFDKTKEIREQIKASIEALEKEKENLETEKKRGRKEYEEFKLSQEYKNYTEEREKREREKSKLSQEVFNLKEEMNFRELLKKFHDDEKKSELLRKYQGNFLETLERDENLEILKIIPLKFMEELENIRTRNLELKKEVAYETRGKLEKYEEEFKKLISLIISKKNSIGQETKKQGRFDEKQEELLKEIKDKAGIINIAIKDFSVSIK